MKAKIPKEELFEKLALLDDNSLKSSELMYKFECQVKGLKSLYLNWFDEVLIYQNLSRTYINKKLSAYSNLDQLWALIQSNFSEGLLDQEKISKKSLASRLEEFKNTFSQFIDPEPILNYFRIEEDRDNYRVCLSVEPMSGIVRLSYCIQAVQGIQSPFLDYMKMKFNMFDIHDALESDTLDFIMLRTHKKPPTVVNNFQLFAINFCNKITGKSALEKIKLAAARQRNFLEEFIPFCKMIYGPDIEGNDQRGLSADLQVVEEYDLKYYIGGREYALPDFSLKIKYTILDKMAEDGSTEEDEISFRLMILYYPLDKHMVHSDQWAPHDIIIDSKK